MESSFIFRLGASDYGLPASALMQTLEKVEAQLVAWMPSFHRGLFPLRGEILPLLDLRPFVNEDASQPEVGNTVLIVDTGNFRFGTLTGAPRYVSTPDEEYPLHPMISLYPALDGVGEVEGRSFTMISPERLEIQLVRAAKEALGPDVA